MDSAVFDLKAKTLLPYHLLQVGDVQVWADQITLTNSSFAVWML